MSFIAVLILSIFIGLSVILISGQDEFHQKGISEPIQVLIDEEKHGKNL